MAKKMKIKAKEKDGVVKVKAMFTSLMADKEEAEKKNIKVDYIAYIVGKANGKLYLKLLQVVLCQRIHF